MREATFKAAKWLMKHKLIYYALQFTWALPMTLIGFLVFFVVSPFSEIAHDTGVIHLRIGKSWGGVSIGVTTITDTTSIDKVSWHELGHTYQNALYGPFMPFLVSIPSFFRYWWRELKYVRKGLTPPTAYDDIWFEGSATEIGLYAKDH